MNAGINNCSICGKIYSYIILYIHIRQGLYRHQRQKHGIDTRSLLQCYHCNQQFPTKYSLIGHMRDHNLFAHAKTNRRIRCAISSCEEVCSTFKSYRWHLESHHSYKLEMKTMRFDNKEKFLEWKNQMEEQQKVTFVQDTSPKILKQVKRFYYICHRSFLPRQKQNPKRHPKNIGSNKIERACPAMIIASMGDTIVDVQFFETHVGHACEIGRNQLSTADRNRLAGKLVEGVTVQRVLDDVREEAVKSGCISRRIHLLEKKDLRNIKRDFSISYATKLHENDALSIKLWVAQMRQRNLENCEVLYYKEQGQVSSHSDLFLKDDDFLLIIMTEFQQNMFIKYGQDKICIDGTHGLNAYNFQLYTIMVVDGFGHGVPVAFCFSNRCDTEVFKIYFNCIKKKIGIVKTNVFMSDDAPSFYNAWCLIMGSATYQLLCTWHVSRNWFQNLNKITGPSYSEKRKLVFKTLKVLQKEVDETTFFSGLNNFLLDLNNDPDTISFGEYFLKTYANRTEKWGYYARQHVGINTNMYLESLHKKIKYSYLDGKQCKRLDKSLNALLILVRDSAFEQIIHFSKNKLTAKTLKIRESHKRSTEVLESSIHILGDKKWQVDSSKRELVTYIVEHITDSICPQSCNLRCLICKICIHNFKCTCLDNVINFNICKHIHSVLTYQHTSQQSEHSADLKYQDISDLSLPSTSNLIQKATTNEAPSAKCNDIKTKCELLLGLCSRSKLDDDSYTKIIKHLDSAIAEANKGEINFMSNVNVNKKIEPQLRFYNKSKLKQRSMVPHPSQIEKSTIQKSFSEGHPSEILNISTGFDHSYT